MGEYKETQISTSGNDKNLKILIQPSMGKFEGMIENRVWIIHINQVSDVDYILVDGEKANFKINKIKNMVELSILKKCKQNHCY